MSGVVTQSRVTPTKIPGFYTNWFDPVTHEPWNIEIPSDQTTTSFRSSVQSDRQDAEAFEQVTYNPFFATNPDDKSDRGHEFNSVKNVTTLFPSRVHFFGTYHFSKCEYDGAADIYVTGSGESPSYTQISDMTDNDLKYYGNRAISACEPTNPAASLSTFLTEIFFADKEIPHFNSDAWLRALTGGGHITDLIGDTALVVEFGFKPFLNDVAKLMTNVQNSYKIIKQYERDAGKPIRRRFTFPETVETKNVETDYVGHMNFPLPYSDVGATTDVTYTQYLRTKYWFSGSFMYALPIGKDLLSRFARYDQLANQVLGSDFTPLTLWNITPWTWLVDWFVDLQSAISISSSMTEHGLVLRYGYLMRQTTSVNTLTLAGVSFPGGRSRTFTKTFSSVKKERRRATPYGFGVNPGEFSPEQVAILLALGLSRGLLLP